MVHTLLGLNPSRYLTRSIRRPSCNEKVNASRASVQSAETGSPESAPVLPVVVPARAMDVAVRQLLRGRGSHLGDLDVEIQVLTRQRVVAVDRNHIADDLRNGHGAHAMG